MTTTPSLLQNRSAGTSVTTATNPHGSEIVRLALQWVTGKHKMWRRLHNYDEQQIHQSISQQIQQSILQQIQQSIPQQIQQSILQQIQQGSLQQIRQSIPQQIQQSIPQHQGTAAGKVLGTYSRADTHNTHPYTLDTSKSTQKNTHKDTLGELMEGNLGNMATAIIDRRTKYRVGSPMLPVLPVDTRPLAHGSNKFPDSATHREKIKTILADNSIVTRGINGGIKVAYRLHAESELNDRYITITCRAVYQPPARSEGSEGSEVTWPRAVQQIREYLDSEKIHLAIEVIADTLHDGLATFPFKTDIYQWNEVLLPIVCELLNAGGHQWITLDMVYRNDVEEPAKTKRPTILISARDPDEQSWWDNTLPAIQQLPQVAEYNILVELVYRQDYLTVDPDPITLAQCFDWRISVPLGASCGSNSTKSGTLGGSLRLADPDTGIEQSFGLTNHHVLCNHVVGEGPFTTFEDGPIKVDCPSSADREFYVKGLQNTYDFFKNRCKARSRAPTDDSALETTGKKLEEAKNFDTSLGQVYASSGLRSTQNQQSDEALRDEWALDWCLTTIEGRTVESEMRHSRFGTKEVVQYCSLKPDQGYSVFKKGRTTGGTTGFISATQSVLGYRTIVPEPENGDTASLVKLDIFPKPVRCHAMIEDWRSLHPNGESSGEFIRPGDSGSLIVLDPYNSALSEDDHPWKPVESDIATLRDEKASSDVEGEKGQGEAMIVGLAFAGKTEQMISYMIPMDLVVQDIQSVTGLNVVEPTLAGTVNRNRLE
jgi:hypothetical protein